MKKGTFFLDVATRGGVEDVPFILQFKNNKGKTIWSRPMTAPFSGLVEGSLPEPGYLLQFLAKPCRREMPKLVYYPNPASDQITIEWNGTGEVDEKAILTLTNLTGTVFFKQEVITPVSMTIPVDRFRRGFYVLSVASNDYSQKKMILIR